MAQAVSAKVGSAAAIAVPLVCGAGCFPAGHHRTDQVGMQRGGRALIPGLGSWLGCNSSP